MKQPTWTLEDIRQKTAKDVEALRKNAIRLGAQSVADLCDIILAEHRPKRSTARSTVERNQVDFVMEYHFVCRDGLGVTDVGDGKFRSASWVVALDVAERSLINGAKFALHNSKAENSYKQGQIVGIDQIHDFRHGETSKRVDFIVMADDKSLAWAGSGTGEKGYLWRSEVSEPGT